MTDDSEDGCGLRSLPANGVYRFRPHLVCSVEQALRNAHNVNTVYTPLGLILAFYEFLCLRSGTEICT